MGEARPEAVGLLMGVLDGAFEAVGRAAEPIKPALDFVLPDTGSGGTTDVNPGNLLDSAVQGVSNAVTEGALGIAKIGNDAIFGNGSARERLLMGGLAAVGGAMTARQLHAAWANNVPNVKAPASPGGYARLTDDLGDPKRFIDVSPDAQQLLHQRPGISRRQAQILSSSNGEGVARGFGRWDTSNDIQNASGAGLFETYAARVPEGARGAQVDWARFELASASSVFTATKNNVRVRDLWKRASTDPASLSSAEAEELFGYIQAFGDRTNILVADDLSVGMVGRVSRAEFVDGDVQVFVQHPVGWDDGRIGDRVVRAARLRQLNHRATADHGYAMLKKIYELGDQEFKQFQEFGTTNLPKGLELGPEWYPQALKDVAREFNLGPEHVTELDRAVAAVSFLSEAEDWSTNIVKARKVLDRAGDISDPDFQAWLRDGVTIDTRDTKLGRHTYAGSSKAARAHKKKLAEIWRSVKEGPPGEKGFKVDETTMKKILRLYGGVESVDAVFRTTVARKQRNFYLNIRHPEDAWPVTIDRHAYDAYHGLDSGIQDRPIDQALFDGDQVYDTIADTYRALAAEMGVKPHQVQAVIWETWRMLKGEHPKDGWGRMAEGAPSPDPFMMFVDDANPVNPIFEALTGRGTMPGQLGADLAGPIPVNVLNATDVNGLTSVAVGDEVALLSVIDDYSASSARHMTPGVMTVDRVPAWVNAKPTKVMDLQAHRAATNTDVHYTTTQLASDVDALGGPVATRPGTWITAYHDGKPRTPQGAGKMTRTGNTVVESQDLSYVKLDASEIDPKSWNGSKSPLNTHAWAVVSAELGDDQVARLGLEGYSPAAATNELRAELQRRGFKPIDVQGHYGGTPEASFMVFGITPEEALQIGERFHQDSIVSNDGFLYNRTAPNDPATAGHARAATGMEYNTKGDFRSELFVGGKKVNFAQELDWDSTAPADPATQVQRTAKTKQRYELKVNDGQDLADLADRLEGRGFQDLSIYTNTPHLDGFERAYETVATDGNSYVATRTATGSVAAANGSHVFTRSSSGLPDKAASSGATGWSLRGDGTAVANNTLLVDGRFGATNAEFVGPFDARLDGKKQIGWGYTNGTLTPVFDKAELTSGRFEVTVQGKNVIPANEADLTAAIDAHRHLQDAGFPEKKMKLKTSEGTFDFANSEKTAPAAEVTMTKNGLAVADMHTDRLQKRFERLYGFEFDAGWREGTGGVGGSRVMELDLAVQDQVEAAVGIVMNEYDAVIHRARLRRIGTENITAADRKSGEIAYAYFGWSADSRIMLTREYFSDPEMFSAQLGADRADKWLSSRVPVGPEGIVVHELGHVMHLSARLGEGMRVDSAVDRAVREIAGGRNWSATAADQISRVASTDVSELIAESVSEVLVAPNPSPLAQNVFDVLTDNLNTTMKFRSTPSTVLPKKLKASALVDPDNKFWGQGVEVMFPNGALTVPAPFPSVGKHKKLKPYVQSIVDDGLKSGTTTKIDPRTLHTMQPGVTRDGVGHYIDSTDGALFDQTASATNDQPLVYIRDEGNGRERAILLTGNHRAAAALAKGEQLDAIVVKGPWGPPR